MVIFAILVAVAYNSAAKTAKGAAAVKPFKAFVDAGNVVLSKARRSLSDSRRTRCSR